MTSKNIHAVGEPDDEPTNSLSMEDVRYEEAEYAHGEVSASKVFTTIKVRKPLNDKEWFRLHPGREYQLPASLYLRVSDESVTPEAYLVLAAYRDQFRKEALTPVRLRLAVNSLDTSFLWDMKVPRDGLMSDYHRSLREAAAEAERTWVKLEWNNVNRAYDYYPAPDDLGDPQFPAEKTMLDLIGLGFKDRIIDRESHPVIAEYQGRKA